MFELSSSNHNRILIINANSGKIIHRMEGSARGLREWDFDEAPFFRPQGLVWVQDKIYVADIYNYARRLIDLIRQNVLTVVGKP